MYWAAVQGIAGAQLYYPFNHKVNVVVDEKMLTVTNSVSSGHSLRAHLLQAFATPHNQRRTQRSSEVPHGSLHFCSNVAQHQCVWRSPDLALTVRLTLQASCHPSGSSF